MARTLSLLFAAGCLGGLLNSMTVWGAGQLGLTTNLGVALSAHCLGRIVGCFVPAASEPSALVAQGAAVQPWAKPGAALHRFSLQGR